MIAIIIQTLDDALDCDNDGLVQDCSNAIANALELLQPWTTPLIYGKVYRQISNISHTKSQTLHVSHLVLQLSLPNPLKPGIKSKMKM